MSVHSVLLRDQKDGAPRADMSEAALSQVKAASATRATGTHPRSGADEALTPAEPADRVVAVERPPRGRAARPVARPVTRPARAPGWTEGVLEAAAQRPTGRDVAEDDIARTLRAPQDLAALAVGATFPAAVQRGKALEGLSEGVAARHRVGTIFDASQCALIASVIETGAAPPCLARLSERQVRWEKEQRDPASAAPGLQRPRIHACSVNSFNRMVRNVALECRDPRRSVLIGLGSHAPDHGKSFPASCRAPELSAVPSARAPKPLCCRSCCQTAR